MTRPDNVGSLPAPNPTVAYWREEGTLETETMMEFQALRRMRHRVYELRADAGRLYAARPDFPHLSIIMETLDMVLDDKH